MAKIRLTNKQKVWIEEYLATWNATEAARRAHYKGKDETLRAVGYENLMKPHIQQAIEKRMKELTLSADEVLLRLGQHATATISDFIDDAGVISWEAVKEKGYLIKKIIHRKGQQSTIELHDPQAAIVHMGRHYQLFTDKIRIDDWRTDIIMLLRGGKLTQEQVVDELGKDIATELFESAGIQIASS
jgi:phage terminase small subunit